MISVEQLRTALRTRVLTASVATTGSISMSVLNGVFVRSSGSFLTDGFRPGMELKASGFGVTANNGLAVVVQVTAIAIKVDRVLTTDAEAGGRTLAVGMPSRGTTQNVTFDPTPGSPWWEEELVALPVIQTSVGPLGNIETTALYFAKVHVPEGMGPEAADAYAGTIMGLFPPRTAVTLSGGDVARVLPASGPYAKPGMHLRPGFYTVPVVVPVWLQTLNTI